MSKFKICPECGTKNPPNAIECEHCDWDLMSVPVTDEQQETAKKALEETISDKNPLVRVCSECGTKNPPNARKCSNCGEDISNIIKPIGTFNKKSIFIKQICNKLLNDNITSIPNDRVYLESLPGVGRKTANVFLSVIYNVPAIAVDTHVERVSKRLTIAKEKDIPLEVEKKLMRRIPKGIWSKVHHQLVFFGRYKCKSVKPLCKECKLKDYCKYYKELK